MLQRGKRKRNVLQEFSYSGKGFRGPKAKRRKASEAMVETDVPTSSSPGGSSKRKR